MRNSKLLGMETIHKDFTGNLHRDDGPAVIYRDGTLIWYQHGERHRDDGPAYSRRGGATIWYQHGKKHREDGPALIFPDGSFEWWYEGLLHRLGGPAVFDPKGADQKYQWWVKGSLCQTTEDYCHKSGITRDKLMWMLLRYGEVENWN